MSDQKYQAKEDARDALQVAFDEYVAAACGFGFDDSYQASELEDIFYNGGKRWDVIVK